MPGRGRFNISQSLPSGFPSLPKLAPNLDTVSELNSEDNRVQEVVDYMSSKGGGTVKLRAGTYSFDKNLTIPSNITLEGDSFGSVIFNFNGAYGLRATGQAPYSTGTIAVTVGTKTVTGTGTAWTTNLTLDHKIRIDGIPYSIAAITSDTSLTLANTYFGDTLTGNTYIAAIFVENLTLNNLIVIAPYTNAIEFNYTDGIGANGVIIVSAGGNGIDVSNSSRYIMSDITTDGCLASGLAFENVTLVNLTAAAVVNSASSGMSFTNCSQMVILSCPVKYNGVDGIYFSGGSRISVIACESGQNIENGIEASDTTDLNITGVFQRNNLDGIRLSSAATRVSIGIGAICRLNTGYGIRIGASAVRTTVIGNSLTSNTAGTILDSGTATINANNQV